MLKFKLPGLEKSYRTKVVSFEVNLTELCPHNCELFGSTILNQIDFDQRDIVSQSVSIETNGTIYDYRDYGCRNFLKFSDQSSMSFTLFCDDSVPTSASTSVQPQQYDLLKSVGKVRVNITIKD